MDNKQIKLTEYSSLSSRTERKSDFVNSSMSTSSTSKRTRFREGGDPFTTPGRRSTDQDREFSTMLSPSSSKLFKRLSENYSSTTTPGSSTVVDTSQDLKEFQKLLDSSMEQHNADEDSVKLLKHQLSHVQQIKFDNQRKQQMITELHHQLDELLKFKDEAFHYKNEVEILRERLKVKEEDLRRLSDETADTTRETQRIEKDLRAEIAKLVKQSQEDVDSKEGKIKELKSKLATAQGNLESVEKERTEVERQLNALTQSLREQQQLLEHKASQQRELTKKLQEQIAILTDSRNELASKISQLEGQIRGSNLEIGQKDMEIDRLRREVDKLEEGKRYQQSSIGNLETSIQSLRERVMELNVENSLIDDLKRDLSIIPDLRDEINRLAHTLAVTQETLDKERTTLKLVCEDRDRLHDLNSHIESHVEELKKESLRLREQVDELHKVQQEVKYLSKELEHSKQLNSELEIQISKQLKLREEREDKTKVSVHSVANELSIFQRLIESVISGETLTATHDELSISQELVGMEGMRAVLMGTRARIIDALTEITQLRQKDRTSQEDFDKRASQMQTLEIQNSDLQKDVFNLKKIISDQEKSIRSLEEEKTEMDRNVQELEDIIEDQQEEEKSRAKFVFLLFKQLKASATDKRLDGSPSKRGVSSLEITESITWELLQSQFSEQISSHLAERESIKKDRVILQTRIEELESEIEKSTSAYKEAIERAEEQRKDLERQRSREIEELRRKYEDEIDALITDYKTKMKEAEDKDGEMQAQYNELNMKYKKAGILIDMLKGDVEDLHTEKEKLQNCMKLLARGVRPMRNKISDLREHKKILNLQVRYLERLHKGIYESVKQLSGEFQLEEDLGFSPEIISKPKTSFRAAAIAVMAFNRLRKVKAKENKDQVYNLGSDKVHLLDEAEIPDIDASKLPYGMDNDPTNVQAFIQLCHYLDPSISEDRSNKDMTLILSLQDGLDRLLTRKNQIAALSSYRTPVKSKFSEPLQSIAHKSPAKWAIEKVQRTTIGISKVFKELLKERNVLQKEAAELAEKVARNQRSMTELEENARKKQELIVFMEGRISELQEENMHLIQPEKYNLQQREIEKLRENYANIQYEKEQLKQEFESQMTALNSYRMDLQEAQDRLRERTGRLDLVSKDLHQKNLDLERMQAAISKHNDMMKDLEQEKNKYEYMVQDLRDKLYRRTSDISTASASRLSYSDADKTSIISRRNIEEIEQKASIIETKLREREQRAIIDQVSTLSPSFSVIRKRVEKDLNESQQMMKHLTESTAKTNREVHELDQELKNARAHLAELQQNLNNSYGNITVDSPGSPTLPKRSSSASRASSAGRALSASTRRSYTFDEVVDDVEEDLFALSSRPPSRRSKRRTAKPDTSSNSSALYDY